MSEASAEGEGTRDSRFRLFYQRSLKREVDRFCRDRQSFYGKAAACAVLPAALGGVLLWAGLFRNNEYLPGALVFLSFGYWLYWWRFRHLTEPLRQRYKQTIVKPIAVSVHPAMVYRPDSFVSSELFDASRLFDAWNSMHGSDYFRGTTREGVGFEFSRLSVTAGTGTSNARHSSNVFHGLFLVADCERADDGLTLLFPDGAESRLGWLGRRLQELHVLRPGRLLNLEDPNFEKAFCVFASDPDAARRILSPVVMERLAALRHRRGDDVFLSFTGGRMFAGLVSSVNHFEPPPKNSQLGFAWCRECWRDIACCLELLEFAR